MDAFAIIILLVNALAMLLLPRRWAPLPLLIGACYISYYDVIQLGAFNLSILRICIAAGLVRIIIRGDRLVGRMNGLDWLMLVWSVWMLFSSLFHNDPSAALANRVGLVYDACGIYLLIRVFCQSLDDIKNLIRLMAVLLLPVALEMIYEKLMRYNLFYAIGGLSLNIEFREGHIRAQGPFAHSILAGTVGAVCLPLIVPLWSQQRKVAVIGLGACLVIIITSASSGPILSAMAAVGALVMWYYPRRIRLVRWLAVAGYIALDLVMKDPAYFILARIDLTGGSTGWHRARLIESAIEHLSEWWIVGTDYTRHWMPTGVYWTQSHADITNHYLQMGIWGGLPLMLLFIAILAKGFSYVGQALQKMSELPAQSRFLVWALGASLFAHAVTFISVSYFDQTFLFFYLTLAAIGSARSEAVRLAGYRISSSALQVQMR